jgi:protein-S-isoprenylcysteine O-methyltransferase Ste14
LIAQVFPALAWRLQTIVVMNHLAKLKYASDTSIFFNSLAGFAVAVLVMLGIGGTVYKLVTPGGWLAQFFGRSVAGGFGAVLAFLVIGLCFWFARGWISISGRNRYSELPVYLFAGTGLIYTVQIMMKGGV